MAGHNHDHILFQDLELAFCKSLNLREVTIAQIQNAFANSQITAVDLTRCYIRRIEALNPTLNTVIEVNPDALEIASELDKERKESGIRSPLHGIPILLKDNIGTADKMETCAGSLALVGLKPKEDSVVVQKLRKAGAIVLGKANLSEFANFRDGAIPNGWSGRGGQTHNAYISTKDPMGSSSGSAVSVAANLAVAALGSETDGSIIAPSSVASIVGFKPTVGNVSGDGVIPLSASQDSVGPMTRTVADAALLYNVIANNPIDTKCFDINHPDIHCCLHQEVRIGVYRALWEVVETEMKEKIELGLEALELSGIILVDPVQPDEGLDEKVSGDYEQAILNCEFKAGINEYLSTKVTPGNIKSLADIIKFNEANPVEKAYGQGILIDAEATKGIDEPGYIEKRDTNKSGARNVIDNILKKYNLNALVAPSESGARQYAAIAGYPIITVPVGFIRSTGIPFGVSFFGTANSEETLLLLAYRFESVFNGRKTSFFKKGEL